MNKRDTRYGFIRVISMFLVIGVHSLSLISRNTDGQVLAGHFLSRIHACRRLLRQSETLH